ncbi:hypothetical protein GCM10007862_17240 [Dyella lipolytica]|uniref:hypothetical protein n=1 Tax=Dyella lipolytica TaxID=1867835 RepID=UPI00235C555C|nr:hypothetical protein [Dyella lipolytica]GLQ46673.1 hypothetical protein GCM10007862_17240 [Dyella lipolytica]
MKRFCTMLMAISLAMFVGAFAPAQASQDTPVAKQGAPNLSGLHDFDFLVGTWHGHHRKLKARLAGSHEWIEFDGTLDVRKLMDGFADVSDNVINLPDGVYRGVGLRSYDPVSGQWASWFLDGRYPADNLDPPMKGSFVNGVGTLYADDVLQGKPIKVRVIWSHITSTSARWEQAYSPDGGKTWETNWVSDFTRVH